MPDDLYDRDFHAWTMRESDLLQRLARGDRVNAEADWAPLAAEIERVGRNRSSTSASFQRPSAEVVA